MAEKLKIVLLGVVLLLAAAVVYGYVDDGGDSDAPAGAGGDVDAIVAEPPVAAPPPDAPEAAPTESGGAGKPAGSEKPAGSSQGGDGRKSPTGGRSEGGNEDRKPSRASGEDRSDDKPADAAAAPSRSEFVRRADAICLAVPDRFAKRAKQVQKEAGGAAGGVIPPDKLYREAAAPALSEAARDLGDLRPPAGDGDEVAALAAALEQAAKAMRSFDGGSGLSEDPFVRFAELAKGLGLKRCSQFQNI